MNAGEQLLNHARLDARVRSLLGDQQRLEAALASDPRLDGARQRFESAQAEQQAKAAEVRAREREVEDKRARLRDRDRELMSGRIRNPTELTKLSAEVDHLRDRVRAEEDVELELMTELEALDARLQEARQELERVQGEFEASVPELRSQLESVRQQLVESEAARSAAWAAIPADYQAAAQRVRAQPPVAEVSGNQCRACHVGLTSGAVQRLRRGELVTCDHCGRVLVLG